MRRTPEGLGPSQDMSEAPGGSLRAPAGRLFAVRSGQAGRECAPEGAGPCTCRSELGPALRQDRVLRADAAGGTSRRVRAPSTPLRARASRRQAGAVRAGAVLCSRRTKSRRCPEAKPRGTVTHSQVKRTAGTAPPLTRGLCHASLWQIAKEVSVSVTRPTVATVCHPVAGPVPVNTGAFCVTLMVMALLL